MKLVFDANYKADAPAAAFGRLCVETRCFFLNPNMLSQPPSGGCVLKPKNILATYRMWQAAAFGRLCVETCGDGGA